MHIIPRLLFFTGAFVALPGVVAAQNVPSKVFLNGVPTPVHFSDGDTFRVLAGPHANTSARLAGFNTLESYGPVHRWGTWDAKEMFALAKLGTLNARSGVWHCTTEDFETDTYGRVLWYCPDLARDQIRRGLAHAMTIDETTSDPSYLEAQRLAIREKRGMWAHGVPGYVMTSLHSTTEEGGDEDGTQYNRLVSTRDGHSNSWAHKNAYDACQWVCSTERDVTEEVVNAAAEALRADPELSDAVEALAPARLRQIVDDYARVGWFAGFEKDSSAKAKLEAALAKLRADGKLETSEEKEGSCVLYVEFGSRYNKGRPECLR